MSKKSVKENAAETGNPFVRIKETIVVEGKDDESAVLAAVSANVICTHGYGIRQQTLDLIKKAYDTVGIVIFTDPDHAGLRIRERLLRDFPNARQAFLTREQAEKDGDIGVENARPESVIRALSAAGCQFEGSSADNSEDADPVCFTPVTMKDMTELGLAGGKDSARLRSKAGAALGIGSANCATFLKRLSFMNIGLEDLIKAFDN